MKKSPEFTKGLGQALAGLKSLYDWGVQEGLTTPADLRLTVMARQNAAKKLIESGVSQRQAAKALGVGLGTVQRDLTKSGSKSDPKRVGTKPERRPKQPKGKPEACETPQDYWELSLSHSAGEAIAMRAYWKDAFGDWEKFKVPSDLLTLAEQARDEWQAVTEMLKRRKT